jgi:hypothetical protein
LPAARKQRFVEATVDVDIDVAQFKTLAAMIAQRDDVLRS